MACPSLEWREKVIRFIYLFILKIYLFMVDREREREREGGRGRSRLHAGSPMWDLIPGLQDHAPGPKADPQPLSHPVAPVLFF